MTAGDMKTELSEKFERVEVKSTGQVDVIRLWALSINYVSEIADEVVGINLDESWADLGYY